MLFLTEPDLTFLHTVKWFQALQYNTNNLINISHLYADK